MPIDLLSKALSDVLMAKGSLKSIELEEFYSYFSLEDCLTYIGWAMGRAGWTENDLPQSQFRLLNDLQGAFDEEALANMFEYWTFDFDRLFARGRKGWGEGRAPAKPQIDVWVEITSKGNLKAEWFPRTDAFGDLSKSDFPNFQRFEQRGAAFDTRPSNELFFLHEVRTLVYDLEADRRCPSAELATPLLAACARVVSQLKMRLKRHFDVRMRADVRIIWNERDRSRANVDRVPDRVVKFEIIDPAEEKRLQEMQELQSMEENLGFSEAALLEAKRQVEARKNKSGPPPSPHTIPERIDRELKKQGYPSTVGKVKSALKLVEKYRTSGKVVSLRP